MFKEIQNSKAVKKAKMNLMETHVYKFKTRCTI